MLTLITYPGHFGPISNSPFSVKAIYLLNASGQVWQREDNGDPRRMPRQKLPVMRAPEGLIHDSDNVRQYLEDRGADFMPGLSAADKGISRALIRMAEEHMYFLVVLDRWENDDVWPIVRDAYFSSIPTPLRGLITGSIRKGVLKGLHTQGLGRLTWEERMIRLEQDLEAITAQLGETPFLFGDHPTLADMSVAPMLDGMRAAPVDTLITLRIKGDTTLVAYCDRVHDALKESVSADAAFLSLCA